MNGGDRFHIFDSVRLPRPQLLDGPSNGDYISFLGRDLDLKGHGHDCAHSGRPTEEVTGGNDSAPIQPVKS